MTLVLWKGALHKEFIKTTGKHGGSVEFSLVANENRSRSEKIRLLIKI